MAFLSDQLGAGPIVLVVAAIAAGRRQSTGPSSSGLGYGKWQARQGYSGVLVMGLLAALSQLH